jgi:hypothetical protein
MFPLEHYSDKVSYRRNKLGYHGIMVDKPLKKGDVICKFLINNDLVFTDMPVFKTLNKLLNGFVPESQVAQFSLALKILYHPKKYQHIHKYILDNYTPFKAFLFKEDELNLTKDTLFYYITKINKMNFDNIMIKYRQIENDIDFNSEHKLKVIYSFCCSHSHGISIDETNVRCINPAIYINHTDNETSPKLKHTVEDRYWIISADKDYNVDQEILDCYCIKSKLNHPYYPNLILKDWKIPMSISYGVMDELDNDQNNLKPSGFELDNDLNEDKFNYVDKTYQVVKQNMKHIEIEFNELNKKSDRTLSSLEKRRKGCLNVIIKTIKLELSYFDKFKEQLDKDTKNNINIEIS